MINREAWYREVLSWTDAEPIDPETWAALRMLEKSLKVYSLEKDPNLPGHFEIVIDGLVVQLAVMAPGRDPTLKVEWLDSPPPTGSLLQIGNEFKLSLLLASLDRIEQVAIEDHKRQVEKLKQELNPEVFNALVRNLFQPGEEFTSEEFLDRAGPSIKDLLRDK